MKTMIWKELRENFKWALLAFLVLLIAEAYTLSSGRYDRMDPYNNVTLCGTSFLMVTSFGCAIIGAALGVVQILPELPRDRWAALLHRPVSRDAIYFGKVVAGMLLYFPATTIPFVISTIYVLIPGQFAAPLVPGMLIPGLSDLFLGPVFYFTAILTCLHQGRWFGSRGLVGLAAVLILLLHLSTGWPFLLPILAAIVLFLAAWGTLAANGQMERMPLLTKTALVLTLLTGAQTFWFIIVFGLQCLVSFNKTVNVIYSDFGDFQIRRDGRVFVVAQHGDATARTLTDADGKAVTDEELLDDTNYDHFLQVLPFSFRGRPWFTDTSYRDNQPRNIFVYIRALNENYGQGPENWYFLIGQNYFIGYDKLSRRCLGICDADGFKPAGSIPKPFPHLLMTYDYWSGTPARLYWSGSQIYSINFPDRTMTPVFNTGTDPISGAMSLTLPSSSEKVDRIAVALADKTLFLDPQGKLLVSLPFTRDPATYVNLYLGNNQKANRIYLQYSPTDMPLLSKRNEPQPPTLLDELDLQGNLIHTYTHPNEKLAVRYPNWVEQLATYSTPLLPALIGKLTNRRLPIDPYEDPYVVTSFPSVALNISRLQAAVLLALALAFGIITLFWAGRAGFSGKKTGLWALFVFCFGLPGLLTFRLISNWPTRVRCPQCHAKRPIETEECPSCRKEWPAPPVTGIEIFEPRETAFALDKKI